MRTDAVRGRSRNDDRCAVVAPRVANDGVAVLPTPSSVRRSPLRRAAVRAERHGFKLTQKDRMTTPIVTFASLPLIEPLQRALAAKQYMNATPIQAQAIKPLLDGRDFLGIAQTGTG